MSVECLEPIGSIEQNFTFLGASFTVYDNARNPLCQIQGPNIFCCCVSKESQFQVTHSKSKVSSQKQEFTEILLQIVSLDGTHQIASVMRQWDHLLLDYTITLTVPADTCVKLKSLLLGAVFLLVCTEFRYVNFLTVDYDYISI